MKIAVLGCGGVGGYYGGKLALFYSANKNVEIIFIARGSHLEAIRLHGLKVRGPEKEFAAFPKVAVDFPLGQGMFDVLLVCVKMYDIEAAIELVRTNVNAKTVIIPLVNGIEGFEILERAFPSSAVFRGCCYLNSYVEGPGVIKCRGGFEQVQIGYPDAALRNKIADILSAAGMDVFAADDISVKVWEKFIFVSVLSSIGSLKNESFGDIAANTERMNLARKMMEEVHSVAIGKGILLTEGIIESSLAKISTFPKESRTSMQLDFSRGKRTEIETFIGYVIRCAEELKIQVPEYKKVYFSLSGSDR